MTYKHLGTDVTETHVLTHGEWNSMPEMFSYGSNETGVRNKCGDEVDHSTFRLIQHGWLDWRAAGQFIIKALNKGWTVNKINSVMAYLKEKKNRPPRGKTA